MTPEEYTEACSTAIESLTEIAKYTQNGEKGLQKWEAAWLFVVILSFKSVVGTPEDSGGGDDYRIDGTLY